MILIENNDWFLVSKSLNVSYFERIQGENVTLVLT